MGDDAQVIGRDANVAIGDDEKIVFGFVDQANQAADFIVDGVAAGAEDQADVAVRKIALQFFEDRDGRIVLIYAK